MNLWCVYSDRKKNIIINKTLLIVAISLCWWHNIIRKCFNIEGCWKYLSEIYKKKHWTTFCVIDTFAQLFYDPQSKDSIVRRGVFWSNKVCTFCLILWFNVTTIIMQSRASGIIYPFDMCSLALITICRRSCFEMQPRSVSDNAPTETSGISLMQYALIHTTTIIHDSFKF